jgi:hypothetical protein
VCLAAHESEFRRWTPGNVKLLLPPRQSRGVSFVWLGLFSGAGGRFILYRPGQPPLDAPQVPIDYQLMKSVGDSTMAVGKVVVPY